MDRLGALKLFVRAVEAKSFVAAGRDLGISASAVGKGIARLETRLGSRLLQRDTHRLSVTPEGTLFLARCRRMLAEYEAAAAAAELASPETGLRGVLRISAPAWATMLGALIGRFGEEQPGVRLEIHFADRIVDVIGERYGLVFRTGALEDSALVRRLVGRFAHAIVASPTYLRQHGRPETAAALTGHRCIHRRRVTDGKIEPWPLEGVPRASDGLVVSTVDARIALALGGAGIACVPAPCVAEHIRTGRLVPLFAESLRASNTLHAVWARTTSPLVRAFLALLPRVGLPGFTRRA